MYTVDKNNEKVFLNYLSNNLNITYTNMSMYFMYVDDKHLFFKHVLLWLSDVVEATDNLRIIFVRHDYRNPNAFVIKNIKTNMVYFLLMKPSISSIIVEVSPDQKYIHNYYGDTYADNDFWTCCLSTICYIKMMSSKVSIIKNGYIGGDMYMPLFFTKYNITSDVMGDILKYVVYKRNYIECNEIWIDIDDFVSKIDKSTDHIQYANIYGNLTTASEEDLSYLLFKVLVALSINHKHSIISQEFITCLDSYRAYPLQYYVAQKNSINDNWGYYMSRNFLLEISYRNGIIKSCQICIQYIDSVRFMGDLVPHKFNQMLLKELEST